VDARPDENGKNGGEQQAVESLWGYNSPFDHVNLPIILQCCALLALSIGPAIAQSSSTEEMAERARIAMVEERYDEAAAIYQELLKTAPDSVGLHMSLGIARHGQGQYKKAVEQFRIVVKAQTDFSAAWRMLGSSFGKLGDKDGAVSALAHAAELEPHSMDVLMDYAAALLAAGKHERASAEFWKVAQTNPSEPRVWHGLAVSNAALAKSERDEAKKKEFRDRAVQALEQLKETAGPEQEELLKEATAAVEEKL
jgi:predicted Zn-dependent protease